MISVRAVFVALEEKLGEHFVCWRIQRVAVCQRLFGIGES